MKDRNLESIKAELRDSNEAKLGFETIRLYSNTNSLADLLRHHKQKPVYEEELNLRLSIDNLLRYYSFLFIAVLAGYIPKSLDKKTISEIKRVLGNKEIRNYYEVNYPDEILAYTLKFFSMTKEIDITASPVSIASFNEFIGLTRFINSDNDVKDFLSFLDYITINGNNILDLTLILSSHHLLAEAIIGNNENDSLSSSVRGYIKYLGFLSQLKEILVQTKEYPLLQSAMWVYHGYYLKRLKEQRQGFVELSFHAFRKTANDPEMLESVLPNILSGYNIKDFSIETVNSLVNTSINNAKKDVDFILNKRWEAPLKKLFT